MPERGCQTTRPGVSVVFVISNCNNSEAEEVPFRARKPHPCRPRSVAPEGTATHYKTVWTPQVISAAATLHPETCGRHSDGPACRPYPG